MKVVAIVQARMGSSRLPGKVLKPLGDNVVLEFLLKRLAQSATLDEIIAATTELADDNQIVDLVGNDTVKVHRGSENDDYNCLTDAGGCQGRLA